jgi:hypothetical protein
MTTDADLIGLLSAVINRYKTSFADKVYSEENNDHDVIMDLFSITPILKRENRQYWGRELGMCWQLVVSTLCKARCNDYAPPKRFGADEPYDLVVGKYAIDTKYRIGSGDAGTLKKFKQYGPMLKKEGYTPVLLIVRSDNLPAAITACRSGEWNVYHSTDAFEFIKNLTKYDLYAALHSMHGKFIVERKQVRLLE